MSQKRHQEENKTRSVATGSDDKRRKVPSFKNVVMEVIRMNAANRFLEPVLEPLIRRVTIMWKGVMYGIEKGVIFIGAPPVNH